MNRRTGSVFFYSLLGNVFFPPTAFGQEGKGSGEEYSGVEIETGGSVCDGSIMLDLHIKDYMGGAERTN